MYKVVRAWVDRYFSDEEAVVLFMMLVGGLLGILLWGDIMAPVIASIIIAFILQGLVTYQTNRGMPQIAAVLSSFAVFIAIVVAAFLVMLPLVWDQLSSLLNDFPQILKHLQSYITSFQESYPGVITFEDLDLIYQQVSSEVTNLVQWLASNSLQSLPLFITFLIYCVVVPILVFFFLKDKDRMFTSIGRLLPNNRKLMTKVWKEMNEQFANYVRGKVVEIIIIGSVSFITFTLFDLNYSALLGLLVGLSVIIPYIGAVLVTIPVIMVAMFQFGFSDQFYYVLAAYFVIQILDGNVLVPLLFSEVVNLHPVIIIVAVLFFGGVWGIWGVFFAIPLATIVKAVYSAWPTLDTASTYLP